MKRIKIGTPVLLNSDVIYNRFLFNKNSGFFQLQPHYGKWPEILQRINEPAIVTGTVNYGQYINLKFTDGFEFGVERNEIL